MERNLKLNKGADANNNGAAPLSLYLNKIICGDCLEVLSQLNSDSVDTVITDPPYGLGFMGKDWDTFKVDYIAEKTKNHKPIDHKLQTERSASMHAGNYDYSRNAEFQQWFTGWAKEVLRVLKPGGLALVFGGTRTYHRLARSRKAKR